MRKSPLMLSLSIVSTTVCRLIVELTPSRSNSFPPHSANPGMSTRNYVLNSSFPPKPLTDETQTLQDAGLLNAVVIQKFQ